MYEILYMWGVTSPLLYIIKEEGIYRYAFKLLIVCTVIHNASIGQCVHPFSRNGHNAPIASPIGEEMILSIFQIKQDMHRSLCIQESIIIRYSSEGCT